MTLPRHTLRSTAYDLADALDVNELYQQKGWTDGLPIVPPTEERIRRMSPGGGAGSQRHRRGRVHTAAPHHGGESRH